MSPADSGRPPADAAAGATAATAAASQLDDCWNRIGVFGDRSCQELPSCVHCRNCPVYSAAGRSLLERLPPSDYLEEWTTVLADTQRGSERSRLSTDGSVVRSDQSLSVMIFRLATELFALPVGVFLEVSAPFVVHSVPGRSNRLFLGMVNVRGEIMLAASLSNLLDLSPPPDEEQQPGGRMAVASSPQGKWVFPVEEIFGIYLFHRDHVNAAPAVITNSQQSYTCGIFQWQHRSVSLLDSDQIFEALNQQISAP
jgi:chemotaxis-related protein WspD